MLRTFISHFGFLLHIFMQSIGRFWPKSFASNISWILYGLFWLLQQFSDDNHKWLNLLLNLFKWPFFKTFLDIRSPLQPACIENPYFSQYLHWNTTLNIRSVLFHELTSVSFEPVLSAISLSQLPCRLVRNIDKDAIQISNVEEVLFRSKKQNIEIFLYDLAWITLKFVFAILVSSSLLSNRTHT